jgi:hypothetical protein
MLWPQNVERVSLSFTSSNFSHGTSTPCRYSQAEVWEANIWKAKLIDIVK